MLYEKVRKMTKFVVMAQTIYATTMDHIREYGTNAMSCLGIDGRGARI